MIFTHRSGFVNVQKTKLFEIGITTSKFFYKCYFTHNNTLACLHKLVLTVKKDPLLTFLSK